MKIKNHYSIDEIIIITGKSKSTLYREIKSGKLKVKKTLKRGKPVYLVLANELESYIGKPLRNERIWETTDTPLGNQKETITKEDLARTIDELYFKRETSLTKRIEDQALYKLGVAEELIKHLEGEKETLRQENELLRESLKILPGPVAEVTEKLEALEKLEEENKTLKTSLALLPAEPEKVNKILIENRNIIQKLKEEKEEELKIAQDKEETLKKQIELLPAKPEEIKEILLQNADNLKALQQENSSLKATSEIRLEKELELQTQLSRAMEEKEEALKAMSKTAEKEKIEIAEAWQKKVDEMSRPWWKFW